MNGIYKNMENILRHPVHVNKSRITLWILLWRIRLIHKAVIISKALWNTISSVCRWVLAVRLRQEFFILSCGK